MKVTIKHKNGSVSEVNTGMDIEIDTKSDSFKLVDKKEKDFATGGIIKESKNKLSEMIGAFDFGYLNTPCTGYDSFNELFYNNVSKNETTIKELKYQSDSKDRIISRLKETIISIQSGSVEIIEKNSKIAESLHLKLNEANKEIKELKIMGKDSMETIQLQNDCIIEKNEKILSLKSELDQANKTIRILNPFMNLSTQP